MVSRPLSPAAHRSKDFLVAFGAVLIATGGFAAWLWWQIGGATLVVDVSDAGTVLAPLIATVVCFRAGRRQEGRLRTFWWLLAAACCSWMLGEMIWTGYDLAGSEAPIPSLADVGYLAFIPLAVGALLSHPGLRGSGTRKARTLFDGMAIAVALLFLSWIFVLGPIWRSSDLTSIGGYVTLAYPAGDVIVVFFVILALRRMRTTDRLGLWCLLAGLISLALADSMFAYVVEIKGYTTGNLLDTGWFAGFLFIALGAFASRGGDLREREESPLLALPSLLAPLVPMFVALILAGITMDLEQLQDRVGLTMVFILILLALLRQLLLVVDLVIMSRAGGPGNLFDRMARVALRREPNDLADVGPGRT